MYVCSSHFTDKTTEDISTKLISTYFEGQKSKVKVRIGVGMHLYGVPSNFIYIS